MRRLLRPRDALVRIRGIGAVNPNSSDLGKIALGAVAESRFIETRRRPGEQRRNDEYRANEARSDPRSGRGA